MRARSVRLNSIFARRVHYHCSAEAEVNLNFANRGRVHAHTMHFLFLVYMRTFRAISDRPAGIITMFVTFYSEHNSPDRSFLTGEVEVRWRVVTAKSRHHYSVGDAQSSVERREIQLSAFLAREATL